MTPEAPQEIKELVERFERNIEHYKDASYKEEQLPIRTIDFSHPADKVRHDVMISLVEQMLDLNKNLAKATIPYEKPMIQRRIDSTDNQIDTLVYELYGLTEGEIRIVEKSAG